MGGAPEEGNLAEALVQRMGLGLVVWRLDDASDPARITLVAANPAAPRITKLDFRAMLGRTMGELFPPAISVGRHELYAEVALSGIERSFESAAYPELGEGIVFGRIVPLPNGCVGVVFDGASGHRVAADETLKLNAFLDSIVDNIPAMVFVKDAEHLRYELFNRAGESLSGFAREDIYGKDDRQLFSKELAEFFQAKDRDVLRDGRMLDIPEEPIDTPQGRRWLHTKKIPILAPDGTPRHLLGISLDITERKMAVEALRKAHEDLEIRVENRTRDLVDANAQLKREIDDRQRTQEALAHAEEQLRHSQKMEAVGRLAGGIAHDFNNLLSVIISYSTILARAVDPKSDIAEGLDEVRKAGERAADLTRQLLAFSRQQVLAPRTIDLNDIIDKMDKMLRRVIGEDLQLATTKAPVLGRIKADPGQLEQVIMNLVVNARDAMPQGGNLTIETRDVQIDDTGAWDHLGAAPGPYVVLAVSDTGIGMDRATLGRIFEPFFTTKEQGKGTGLGLSTVFGIVKQSGGHISVASGPNEGTKFEIYFARTDDPFSIDSLADTNPSILQGSETILLVEDEEQVRILAREILIGHGYNVLEAKDPSDALRISANRSEVIDLLVTDIVMPQMNGRLLSERLRSERPEMEVLFMSGYTDNAIDHNGVLGPGVAFLQKPITPFALTKMVRRILDAQVPHRGIAKT
ncbi:MAG TPA: PAS domain-containing protein [Polyangia bacterium]